MTCIAGFPHLVEMQKKFADDGLVVITVSLDPVQENETKVRGLVEKILKKNKMAVTNVILDEKEEVWKALLDLDAVPATFVYDRRGERVKEFKGDFKPSDVEEFTVNLLKKK